MTSPRRPGAMTPVTRPTRPIISWSSTVRTILPPRERDEVTARSSGAGPVWGPRPPNEPGSRHPAPEERRRPTCVGPLVLAQDQGQGDDDDAQQDREDEGHCAPFAPQKRPAHRTAILTRHVTGRDLPPRPHVCAGSAGERNPALGPEPSSVLERSPAPQWTCPEAGRQ